MLKLMAKFSVSCSFLFPNFAPTNGENKVPKPPRALAWERYTRPDSAAKNSIISFFVKNLKPFFFA